MPTNTLRSLKADKFLLLIALVYTIAIAYLSLINLAQSPVKEFGLSDKILHAVAYFGMVILWLFYAVFKFVVERLKEISVIVCVLVIVFGIFIEVLQHILTDYRELDFYDIVANSVGAIAAVLLLWILKDLLIRLKTKINLFLIKI